MPGRAVTRGVALAPVLSAVTCVPCLHPFLPSKRITGNLSVMFPAAPIEAMRGLIEHPRLSAVVLTFLFWERLIPSGNELIRK